MISDTKINFFVDYLQVDILTCLFNGSIKFKKSKILRKAKQVLLF